jgi:hypothetical protein
MFSRDAVKELKRKARIMDNRRSGNGMSLNLNIAAMLARGELSATSDAATTESGRFHFNPLFSLWLMGFPPQRWHRCVEAATRSSPK